MLFFKIKNQNACSYSHTHSLTHGNIQTKTSIETLEKGSTKDFQLNGFSAIMTKWWNLKKGQKWLNYMKTFVKYSTIDHAHTQHWRIQVELFNHRTLSYEFPGLKHLQRWLKKDANNKNQRNTLNEGKINFSPMKMRIICAGRIHFNFYFTHSVCINRQEVTATPSSSSNK